MPSAKIAKFEEPMPPGAVLVSWLEIVPRGSGLDFANFNEPKLGRIVVCTMQMLSRGNGFMGLFSGPPSDEPTISTQQRYGFRSGEFVVYPVHGVGQILAIEEQEIAGAKLELFVINFMKDKMTLRVPTKKAANVGMRKLSDSATIQQVQRTLSFPRHVAKGNWARLVQEYENKINSGDIVAIAEVVRDLYRPAATSGQSYSERQLYAAALDRLSREVAVVQHITDEEAVEELESLVIAGFARRV